MLDTPLVTEAQSRCLQQLCCPCIQNDTVHSLLYSPCTVRYLLTTDRLYLISFLFLQYNMELLAVDVQIPAEDGRSTGEQQRVFVLGTPSQCRPYNGLIASLARTFHAAAVSEAHLAK